jgi:fimbrial chaperone protein
VSSLPLPGVTTDPPSGRIRGKLALPALALAVLAAALCSGAAEAFQLVPMSQDFSPTGPGTNQTFRVENDRDEQVAVVVTVTTREMDLDGKETRTPSDDFAVFPSEIVLNPKGVQTIRVKWLGDPGPKVELAYRVIAQETPLHARRGSPGGSITMVVRYEATAYVVPRGASADVVVSSAKAVAGPQGATRLELVLDNRGTRHAIIDQPVLTLTAGGVSRELSGADLEHVLAGENVLAHHQRRFLLPWPAGLPVGPVEARLKAFNLH